MDQRITNEPADSPLVVNAKVRLHEDGWQTDDFVEDDSSGRPCWVATGMKGGILIQTEGATKEEAWLCAVEQARSLGMRGEER